MYCEETPLKGSGINLSFVGNQDVSALSVRFGDVCLIIQVEETRVHVTFQMHCESELA